jgi:hypothetical protein
MADHCGPWQGIGHAHGVQDATTLARVEAELGGLLQHGAVVGSSGEQEDGGNSVDQARR